ncbi:MFS transporter [Natronomonas sp. F2-12]|uniref:MFS transporter n=1 Tax=Natronomonas aquatica TaxID=2841590 RepID=A0A9R1CQL1_9EURY|nr:MFS transporter [Natronomonas aquatica]MCQ4333259.1 MFS transporter [Natronomonas aquatica]
MPGALRRMTEVSRPRTVGPITVGHGINEFFSIVIPPIIPLLIADLGVTYGQAGFLLTVFFVMYSLFQLPAGLVADRIGKNRLMLAGLVGMTGGIVIAGMATTYGALAIAQVVAGIAGSTFHPTGLSIISDIETADTEGKAMGVFGVGGTLGTMAAPLAVGGLAAVSGWRIALLGAALLGGSATLLVAYFLVSFDVDVTPSIRSDGGRIAATEWVRGVRATATELATRDIGLLCLITLVMSLQHRAIQTFTTSYVAAETGATVSVSNLAFFALLVGGSVASLWGGDLADRLNRYYLGIGAALATAVLVGASLLVAHATAGLPFVLLIAALVAWFVVIGAAMYAVYPVKNALVSERAEEAHSGSLFGVVQTGSALGSAIGPAVFGVLATRWGIIAAFPAIAGVGVVLAALFGVLLASE